MATNSGGDQIDRPWAGGGGTAHDVECRRSVPDVRCPRPLSRSGAVSAGVRVGVAAAPAGAVVDPTASDRRSSDRYAVVVRGDGLMCGDAAAALR